MNLLLRKVHGLTTEHPPKVVVELPGSLVLSLLDVVDCLLRQRDIRVASVRSVMSVADRNILHILRVNQDAEIPPAIEPVHRSAQGLGILFRRLQLFAVLCTVEAKGAFGR